MNDYTPTTDEVLRCYRLPLTSGQGQREGESFAEFLSRRSIEAAQQQVADREAAQRWLAEVERAAAEKAYERGRLDERHDCERYGEYERGEITGPQLRDNLRPLYPYRRNEGENE